MNFPQTTLLVATLAAGAVCQPVKAHELGSRGDPTAIAQSRAAAEAYYDLADATAAGYEPLFDWHRRGRRGGHGPALHQ